MQKGNPEKASPEKASPEKDNPEKDNPEKDNHNQGNPGNHSNPDSPEKRSLCSPERFSLDNRQRIPIPA